MAVNFKLVVPLADETEFIDYDSIQFSSTPYNCDTSKLSDYSAERYVDGVYQGYATDYVSDSFLSKTVVITIKNSYFKNLVLYFEKETFNVGENNSINYVLGSSSSAKKAESSSNIFFISLDNYENQITFSIKIPSKKRLCLNAIVFDYINEYTYRDVKSLSFGYEIASNNKLPNFGLGIPYGSLIFTTRDNNLLTLMEKKSLQTKATFYFYYNGKSIGNLNAKSWNYEEKTFSFSVELSKDISRWEKITVYNYISSSILTAYDLFLALFEYTNLKYYNIENTTKLSKITLKNCTFDNINLYEAFVWFCNLTQTCVYINRNDVLEVVDYV